VNAELLATARKELVQSRLLILAGGLGTRLRSVVADRPKVLALVGGRPFLDILVEQLHGHGVRRIGLLLGHLHEQVQQHVDDVLRLRFADVEFATSVEAMPLGTAGALLHAKRLLTTTTILMNGDTFVAFDPAEVLALHRTSGAAVTMAVQHVNDVSRFGAVELSADGRVVTFREKQARSGAGWINAGIYAFQPALLDVIAPGRPVSLESEVFPGLLATGSHIHSAPQRGYFVDFGTPASYAEFEAYLATKESP
jgi:NDP-sugar pyrophosphorylase family protein